MNEKRRMPDSEIKRHIEAMLARGWTLEELAAKTGRTIKWFKEKLK